MSTGRLLLTHARLAPQAGLSAILIDKGVFAAVVPQDSAGDLAAPGTTTVDLDGRTVLPGLHDSHLHAYEYGRSLLGVDLRGVASTTDLTARLAAARPESTGWIRGGGWDGTVLRGTGPDGGICAADIDNATGGVPALLSDITGHAALANTAALRAAGVDASTPDPDGGSFVRDAHGHPTGVILEAAVGRLNDAIPALTRADRITALRLMQDALLAQGIVAITDPGLGPGARTLMDGTGDLDAIAAYRDLDAAGDLHLRAHLMLLFGGLGGTSADDVVRGLDAWGPPAPAGPDSRVSVAQLKVFADGIPRSRTAWLREPYEDSCSHGHLQLAGDTDDEKVAQLRRIVAEASARGWQIGTHCTGDRTITEYLNAIEATGTGPALRHYVIHGDLVVDDDLPRMAAMGTVLNTNPSIRWAIGHRVEPVLGRARNLRRQPLRTAIDTGVRVCSASDAPVADPDWRRIMACAMTRALSDDPDYCDAQALTAQEAVDSMTTGPAWQSREEDTRGRITPGFGADLVVLDRAVDWARPWSLMEASVSATVVDGDVVWGGL